MELLLTTPMKQFTKETLKDGEADLFLKAVLIIALTRGEIPNASLNDKANQFILGVKIGLATNMVDLTPTEIEMLQILVSKTFSSLIFGQVNLLLKGQPTGL